METKYRDLSAIPNITDNTAWANDTTGAYCAYDNDSDNVCDCNIHFYEHGTDDKYTNFNGYKNDLIKAQGKVAIETKAGAKLTDFTIKIEATKAGFDTLVLEQYSFNVAGYEPDTDDIQHIDIEEATNYKVAEGSDYEYYSLKRSEDDDHDDYVVYEYIYPFRMRYENWATLISQYYPAGTQDWSVYVADGWALRFSVYTSVNETATNHTTEFLHTAEIDIRDFDNETAAIDCEIRTFDAAYTTETDGLVMEGENTVIEATFTMADTSVPAGYTDWYGILTLDNDEIGGYKYCQSASTEESPVAGGIWYTGVTLTVVDGTTITLSAVIDYTKLKDLSAGLHPLNDLNFYARLGLKK